MTRMAAGLLPLVALVAIGESLPRTQWFWDRLQRDDDAFNIARTLETRGRGNGDPTVYVLGDSSVREGVDARIVGKLTGRRVVKLAMAGGTPFDSLLMARRLALGEGDVLAVGVSPYEFKSDAEDPDSVRSHPLYGMLLGSDTCRDTVDFRLKPDEIGDSALRRASAMWRYRPYFRDLVVGGFEKAPWIEFRYKGRISRRDFMMRLTDGTYALNAENSDFTGGHLTARSLKTLKAVAKRNKAELVVFRTPVNPVINGRGLMDPGAAAGFDGALSAYRSASPGEGLQDLRDFNDFFHLNPSGRAIYSNELGKALSEVIQDAN